MMLLNVPTMPSGAWPSCTATGSWPLSWPSSTGPGAAPLDDQRLGSDLVWGMGDMVAPLGILGVLVAWASYDQKEARRIDRRLAEASASQGNGSSLVKRASAAESPHAPPAPDPAKRATGNGHGP
jgi:hypothetical protein